MNKTIIHDFFLYDAIDAGFRLDIAQLKEFYEAATAPRVFISCPHEWNCPAIYVEERRGPCTCGAVERQARLDKALAVLAEASVNVFAALKDGDFCGTPPPARRLRGSSRR
jgi:hypothetical protein